MNLMTADERKDLGRQIKHMRNKKGYSQRELADKIGYKLNTVAKFEQGERVPNLGTLRQIADALDCKVAHIVPSGLFNEDKDNLSPAVQDFVNWLRHMGVACSTPGYEDVDLTYSRKHAIFIGHNDITYNIESSIEDMMKYSLEQALLFIKYFGVEVDEDTLR
jgi:transcriptional regulator with XRE-family HTH domain